MSSDLDIANLALSRLGDAANLSSLDEQSAQAEHCRRFLPIARDEMQETFAFKFTRRRTQPPLRAETSTAWLYAYQEPVDCIRVLAVLPYGYTSDYDGQPFETESAADGAPIIVTNVATATLLYVARVVDPARFTPLFTSALSWLLASMVAGPLLKGDAGAASAQAAYATYQGMMQRAELSSANQGMRLRPDSAPSWISARGGDAQAFRDIEPVRA